MVYSQSEYLILRPVSQRIGMRRLPRRSLIQTPVNQRAGWMMVRRWYLIPMLVSQRTGMRKRMESGRHP